MSKVPQPLLWQPHFVEVVKGDHSAFIGHAIGMRLGDTECILLAQTTGDLSAALVHGIDPNPDGLEIEAYQVTLLHSTKVGIVVNEPQPQFDVSDL